MKQKVKILSLLILIAGIQIAEAQSGQRELLPQMDIIAKPGSTVDWIDFKDDVEVSPSTVFVDYSTFFGLSGADEMRVSKITDDELGYKHYRYQQYAQGYKVDGAEFIVHVNASNHTYAANGKMVVGLTASGAKTINAEIALQNAKQSMGATAWAWESEFWQNEIREHTGNPEATYEPVPELVWFNGLERKSWKPEAFKLTWVMDLHAASPHKSERYFIDALTGEVVAKVALESNCTSASVNTIFNGNRTVYTAIGFLGIPPYSMLNSCQNASWNVLDWGSTTSTMNSTPIISQTNTWTTNNQRFAGSVSWEIGRCYSYFQAVHGRTSYDNASGDLTAYVNAVFSSPSGDYTDNASMSFTGGIMKVGLGSAGTLNNSWSSLDVIAHEYAHAVTGTSAALTYSYESGALNESFSDIFGEVIENYTLGSNDWLLAGERTNGAIRDMSAPGNYGHPDTYLGTNWYAGSGDAGGVHTNSGVMNYWFYLLSTGGSGTNDNGQQFSVSGIGLSAARAIAYRNLTVYLTNSSQYIDAREGAIRAANDLYGSCSNQAIQTGAAWYAVGVGNSLPEFNYIITCGVNSIGGTSTGINSLTTATGSGCSTGATPSFSNIVYRASNFIDLKTGFTGSPFNSNYFAAVIDPCSYTSYRISAPEHETDELVVEEGLPVEQHQEKMLQQDVDLSVWPNPCREQTELSFIVKEETTVKISLYDQKGALVNSIDPGRNIQAGIHRYHLETTSLAPGNYQIVLQIGKEQTTKQLIKNN